jgi:surfactin synthase thioesterase subunit
MSALLCFHTQRNPVISLVALPWAGASASALRSLSEAIARETAAVELHAAAYPGRAHRRAADPGDSIAEVVDDLLPSVRALRGPLVLYGHSYGAAVAFELALALGRDVSMLIAAGRAAPSVEVGGDPDALDDTSLIGWLARRSAVPSLLTDDSARRLLLPPLRHDLGLSLRYRSEATCEVPVLALHGSTDTLVEKEAVRLWKRHTTSGFAMRIVRGGHLFARDNTRATAQALTEVLFSGVVTR